MHHVAALLVQPPYRTRADIAGAVVDQGSHPESLSDLRPASDPNRSLEARLMRVAGNLGFECDERRNPSVGGIGASQ